MPPEDGLDELRRRLTDVVITTKRPDDMTVRELISYIERLVHLVHVRIDGLVPGGDDKQHYKDHQEQETVRQEERETRIRRKVSISNGLWLGIGIVLALWLLLSLWQVFKN